MSRSRSLLIALAPLFAFALNGQSQDPQLQPAATTASVAQPAEKGAAALAAKEAPLGPEQRGDIYMARKMYRDAVEQYRAVPATASILNKIGIAYHQLLDLQTARKYYERAIKADPEYSEAVNNLGTIFYSKKSYGRAVRQYEKALKLSPDAASYYSNLGTAHFARKHYEKAIEAYQQAVKLDPEVFERRAGFGSAIQERNVEERARFHYYLAKIYAKNGLTDQAVLYVRKALEEGFKERNKFLEEPEFAALKQNAEFQLMMVQEPRAL